MKRDSDLQFEEAMLDGSRYATPSSRLTPASRGAFYLVVIGAALMAVLALGRVAHLAFANGETYRDRALSNLSRERSIPVYRAIVTDRYGEPLVTNEGTFSVVAHVPTLLAQGERVSSFITSLAAALKSDAASLADVVSGVDAAYATWVTLARNVGLREAIEVRALDISGLEVIDDFRRRYPDGDVLSHLIGYTGIGDANRITGLAGIERAYDARLRGIEGMVTVYQDARGKVIDERIVDEPVPAEPLALTIDAGLQRYFYARLQDGLSALGRTSGVGIALDPQTGELLSLVSFPSFDPNVFIDRERGADRLELLTDVDQPLFNRAVSGRYSPGSTIKPLVTLAALTEGVVDSTALVFSDGTLEIPNPYFPDQPSIFLDWKAHGWVDAAAALARSSNIFFYAAGGGVPTSVPRHEILQGGIDPAGLGIDRLHQYFERFGFGERTGIDLPFEAESFLPSPEEKEQRTGDPWRLGDTYNASIGQGDLLVTPIQLIDFIASIGNGGTLYRPVLELGSPSEVLTEYREWKDAIAVAQQGLEDAVSASYGTAHLLSSVSMPVAGKTGTPQVANNQRVNAFFAGYAPADDPQIAILILVENAREGSLNTLPIARDVLQWYYENRVVEQKTIEKEAGPGN